MQKAPQPWEIARLSKNAESSRGVRSVKLFRRGVLDVFDDVADGLQFLGVFIGNFHAELFLEGHDEFDRIERIRSEVLDKRGGRRHLLGIHAKFFDDDFFDSFFDRFVGHKMVLVNVGGTRLLAHAKKCNNENTRTTS